MSDQATESVSDKQMKLRYAGVCRLCGRELAARSEAIYERLTKTVRCVVCPHSSADPADMPEADSSVLDTTAEQGNAGASARREYERRKAKDEDRLRQRWGKLGGAAINRYGLVLYQESRFTKQGAEQIARNPKYTSQVCVFWKDNVMAFSTMESKEKLSEWKDLFGAWTPIGDLCP